MELLAASLHIIALENATFEIKSLLVWFVIKIDGHSVEITIPSVSLEIRNELWED